MCYFEFLFSHTLCNEILNNYPGLESNAAIARLAMHVANFRASSVSRTKPSYTGWLGDSMKCFALLEPCRGGTWTETVCNHILASSLHFATDKHGLHYLVWMIFSYCLSVIPGKLVRKHELLLVCPGNALLRLQPTHSVIPSCLSPGKTSSAIGN
jgi:hypothetical protein